MIPKWVSVLCGLILFMIWLVPTMFAVALSPLTWRIML